MRPLSATARLQFHKGFTLPDAERLIPYYATLGVSHLYASPLLTARAGSTHGYDIVNHDEINPELGGEAALRSLVSALRERGMGLILDIVPNHMGVGGHDNRWWLDVLEWGRASPYAEYFDIDWDPPDATMRGRLLAPFLGTSYGEALDGGNLQLRFDADEGRLDVWYYDEHRFPIAPRDYAAVLLTEGGPLEELARVFADPGTGGRAAQRRRVEDARAQLRDPLYRAAIDEALRAYRTDTPEGRDRLHRLLDRQSYRLAWWRAATDEINWRRFFDVNGLAGIRPEVPEVFEATHAKILAMYADGWIDGVRVDHVDGLAFPREYCRKLRRRLDAAHAHRPEDLRDIPPVLWIEKILTGHERLATDWLTDGTTGYDFMSDSSAVLHCASGAEPLTELWTALTGRPGAFEVEAEAARRQILRDNLASELRVVATAVDRIARRDLRTRDYTLSAIQQVLTEILVHFRVYRIYAGPGGISETDRRLLDRALAGARRTVRPMDRPLLELVGHWLAGDGLRDAPVGLRRQEWLRAMVKFQQLSSPVAAKSIEDTAFYRYGRLLSRNEVGSDPAQFCLSATQFHAVSRDRRKRFPRALLATATHDHKRGEDARARLAVLSEVPGEWEAALGRWTRLNAPLKRDLDGPAPDSADEVMLYETLVAAWPLDLDPADRAGLDAYRERVSAWFQKAMREAKRHTGWASPNEEYEAAAQTFLAATLDPERTANVAAEIAAFAGRIAPAGAVNGLAQMLLRLATPGVPDLYQGTEYWDFSLVDPDNRRPVDFAAREASLAAAGEPAALLAHWRDGRVKQAVLARALALRSAAPSLFMEGTYVPLSLDGPAADSALAFARVHEGRAAIAVVSRFAAQLPLVDDMPLVAETAWKETSIVIPRSIAGRRATDVLGGMDERVLPGRLPAGDVLRRLPVALLEVR
jgi:(1->4)-alpha-D-glucan 1-alpha-D-glucosylmutase